MSTPETFSLVEPHRLMAAYETLEQERSDAPSGAAYLNQLLRLYSHPSPQSVALHNRSGEVLFQGSSPSSEASRLADITRSVMLEREPHLSADADAFFRGALLGHHLVTKATDAEDASETGLKFYRDRLINSAPWTKITEGKISFEDIELTPVYVKKMPGRDTTEQDEHAFSEDLLIRQYRISQAIQSRLYPYSDSPRPASEAIAHSIGEEIAPDDQPLFNDYFLMGYRFITKLYSNPDEMHKIADTLKEYEHIPNYGSERAALLANFTPIVEEREKLLSHLQRLCETVQENFNLDELENYQKRFADNLNMYTTEQNLNLIPGSLVQFSGVYNALLTIEHDDGTVSEGDHTESNNSLHIIGAFDGIEVISAPTEESIKIFLRTGDESDVKFHAFVPAIRIVDPQVFDTSSSDPIAFKDGRKYIYTLPLHYTDCFIGVHTPPPADASSLDFEP